MHKIMFKSKIHRAVVTNADLNYVGSITIDEELMKEAEILPYEKVQVVNNNNGQRLETYAIKGKRNSGEICLNGAAARLVQPGDTIIIITYAHYNEKELEEYEPKVVLVNNKNKVVKIINEEIN